MKIKNIIGKPSVSVIISITLIALITFSIGLVLGSRGVLARELNIVGLPALAVGVTPSTQPAGIDIVPLWKAWHILDTRFVDAYTIHSTGTSTTSKISSSTTSTTTTKKENEKKKEQKMVWGMISGLAASMGDPYTVFLPPSDAKIFNADISGSFEGVGMEIAIRDGILTVVSPLKGTPAFRAGIKSADKIVKINDTSTKNMRVGEAVRLIRGKKGTDVTFTILREGERSLRKIKVTRAVIEIPTIKTERLKNGIFMIELSSFTAKSAGLFRGAITKFAASGDKKLIIDLRGNPGGYLSAAVDMASWFLPVGDIVVTEDYGGNADNRVHRSRGYDLLKNRNIELVILIDRGSASAAEILSGSLHEYKKATLIGTRSFGKGSVQELIPLTPETSLKVTIARWLLAGGVFINKQGITPDIKVELPKVRKKGDKTDYILDRAKEYLNTK